MGTESQAMEQVQPGGSQNIQPLNPDVDARTIPYPSGFLPAISGNGTLQKEHRMSPTVQFLCYAPKPYAASTLLSERIEHKDFYLHLDPSHLSPLDKG